MFGGLKISEVKQISSISKKLKIDKSKLPMLRQASKEGRPEEEVMAELLGIPEGVDAKTYLHSVLTEREYEVLKSLFENYSQGKGSNPLN